MSVRGQALCYGAPQHRAEFPSVSVSKRGVRIPVWQALRASDSPACFRHHSATELAFVGRPVFGTGVRRNLHSEKKAFSNPRRIC